MKASVVTPYACVLCGTVDSHLFVRSKVKGDSKGELCVVQCLNCGHIQLNPPNYSLEFYKEDGQVNFVVHDYGTPIEKIVEHSWIEARRRLARFEQHGVLLNQPQMRVLDIGGGYGFFGAECKARYPDFSVEVMEPSKKRADMGLHFLKEQLQDFAIPNFVVEPLNQIYVDKHRGTYDLITMWHVLEHVSDPVDFLRLAVALLRPDRGVLCIEVPNANDELMRLSPAFCDRNYMIEHISYFTHHTLLNAVKRAAPDVTVDVHGYQRYGIFNYFHWIHFNEPQGANPDLIQGEDRWWLETTWRATREAALTSDALFSVIRPA